MIALWRNWSWHMEVINTVAELKEKVRAWKLKGDSIGLVPTMGYLHQGHMSLVKEAVTQNDHVIISIFVNPIQFGVNEDLDCYPRNIERDTQLCKDAGVDVIFFPSVEEMYPQGFSSFVDMSHVTETLCGASRPGHFRGVCTVVMKLFNISGADNAYFGQKDAQQLAVIKRMAKDFNMNVNVVGLPIVREKDGLAMSSRNSYLSEGERVAALCLSASLQEAFKSVQQGNNVHSLKQQIHQTIASEPLAKIDYIEIVNSETMQPIEQIETSALCAIAVFIGKTRLIDNIILG